MKLLYGVGASLLTIMAAMPVIEGDFFKAIYLVLVSTWIVLMRIMWLMEERRDG